MLPIAFCVHSFGPETIPRMTGRLAVRRSALHAQPAMYCQILSFQMIIIILKGCVQCSNPAPGINNCSWTGSEVLGRGS
eukprot:260004-Rhodomonas_salina.1